MAVITYFGHSCFAVTAASGWRAVFDPYQDGSVPGLKLPHIAADAAYASHEHGDHNALNLIAIEPAHEMPYRLETLLTDHDDKGGSLRGKNRIHILAGNGEKIAHFGDLGRDLTPEEIAALMDADAVMIPCGGYYTIDARQAKKIIDEIKPKLAVLMHYRTATSGYDVLSALKEVKEVFPELNILSDHSADTAKVQGIIALTPLQG